MSPQAATVSEDALSFQNDPLFNHPLLRGYWPSERRAILYYRIRLVERLEVKELEDRAPAEVVVEQLLVRWEKGPGGAWRHDKMRRDGEEQMLKIEQHKYYLSERVGRDVGWEYAAKDWIDHHAESWRDWWEQQPEAMGDVPSEFGFSSNPDW